MAEQQPEKNKKQQTPAQDSYPNADPAPMAPGWDQPLTDKSFAGGLRPIPDPAPMAPGFAQEEVPLVRASKNHSAAGKPWSKKIGAAVPSLIFIALAIGGGVFAYDYFFPSPQRVMEKTMAAMSQAKTMEYEGKAGLSFSYASAAASAGGSILGENNKLDLAFDFFGTSDLRDAQRLKNSCRMKIAANPLFEKGAEINTVGIGNAVYFKLNADNSVYKLLLGGIFGNQWIKIDYDKFAAQMKTMYPRLAGTFDSNLIKITPLAPDQTERMRVLAEKSRILVIENELGDETINGAVCRHYRARIDKEALRKFINDAREILKDKISSQGIDLIAAAASAADFSGIEIWAAKKDYILRRFKGSVDSKYDFSGLAPISYGIDIDINLKTVNQPVLIFAPEKAKPLEDVFKNPPLGGG